MHLRRPNWIGLIIAALAMSALVPTQLQAQVYYHVDALAWWMKGNSIPVLVSTSPAGTVRADAGVLDQGATPLVGGDRAEERERYGGRIRVGAWLDQTEDDAIEFHYFGVDRANGNGNYHGTSGGSPILARPFLDAVTGMENAQLVAFPAVIAGSILVDASSEMHSAGILCRRNYMRGPRGRLDFVGGYRFMRFRESLHIQENLISLDPAVIQVGTAIDVLDRFTTENDFNGVEFGFELEVDTGLVIMDVLAKLAVGNVHQEVTVHGQTVVTTPGDPSVHNVGGLLALPTNIGQRDHDEFAILPELNINFRYPLTNSCDLQFGYSVLVLTSVLRTGDQIDRSVNTTQLPMSGVPFAGAPRPGPLFNDSTIWAQGVNLSLTGEF